MDSKHLSSFLGTLYKKHGMSISYISCYVDTYTPCKFMCALHGEFTNKPYNIVHNGKSNGCDECSSLSRRRGSRVKLLYGVGVNDWDDVVYTSCSDKIPEYRMWKDLLKRVYSEKYHLKNPSYIGTTVDHKWHSLKGFIDDVSKLKGYDEALNNGWGLDKDIIALGNKHYSLETCCFVPPKINTNFKSISKSNDLPCGVYLHKSGKYACDVHIEGKAKYLGLYSTPGEAFEVRKAAKCEYMSRLADEWEGRVDDRVIDRLRNYDYETDGRLK